jgi:hypothetical protein
MYRCTGCTNQPINSEVVIEAALMAHSRGVGVISASFILEEGAYADGESEYRCTASISPLDGRSLTTYHRPIDRSPWPHSR